MQPDDSLKAIRVSIKIGFKTDVGRKRKANQDSYVVVPTDQLHGAYDTLLIVADGMGGRRGGEIASSIVAQVLPESIKSAIVAKNGSHETLDSAQLLKEAIHQADRDVHAKQEEVAELSGMGTTLVAATLSGNELTLAHVGDSRAYLLRDGALKQLTDDHSEVWEQVKAGNMTPEEAQHSRFRNIISRAIGTFNPIPDVQKIELIDGDELLICSDGLTSEVEDSEIARIMAGTQDVQTACDLLVKIALDMGGRDNITVIAMQYGEFKSVTLPRVARTRHGDSWHDVPIGPEEKGWDLDEQVSNVLAASKSGYRNSPVLLGALFLISVVALSETYALYSIWQKTAGKQAAAISPILATPLKATDKNLIYSEPMQVFDIPVRDAPLAIDRDGKPLIVTREGALARIEERKTLILPNQSPPIPVSTAKPSNALVVAMDASGNRYEFNPNVKNPGIEKFNPEGNRVEEGIGGKTIRNVSAMSIDESGNIFVIDNHYLLKITADEKVGEQPSDK